MSRLTNHFRSNIVGYVALFVALSGTALAASELDKNEVKSKHIGKGQVKRSDIARNAVNSAKVAQGSLLREDFAPDQLPAGPQGERGAPGESATRLFAYIRDGGEEDEADIVYGSGVTAVEDGPFPPGKGEYVVRFNRDLDHCVVNATTGVGLPSSPPATSGARVARALIREKGRVELLFVSTDSTIQDTSFMITAFC